DRELMPRALGPLMIDDRYEGGTGLSFSRDLDDDLGRQIAHGDAGWAYDVFADADGDVLVVSGRKVCASYRDHVSEPGAWRRNRTDDWPSVLLETLLPEIADRGDAAQSNE